MQQEASTPQEAHRLNLGDMMERARRSGPWWAVRYDAMINGADCAVIPTGYLVDALDDAQLEPLRAEARAAFGKMARYAHQ
jgi:hypothetical protein